MDGEASKGSYVEWSMEQMLSDDNHFLRQLTKHWSFAILSTIAYVTVVFGGSKFMENRKKFDLCRPLICWSTLLAVFSIVGAVRTWALAWEKYQKDGLKLLVCDTAFYRAPITQFWVILFLFSKFAEYADTCFIILRKQKLIFLHWYHHATVALFCWLTFGGEYAGAYIFMILNYAVHGMMYTYYALKAAGFKIPRRVAFIITMSQIVQMMLGLLTTLAVMVWGSRQACKSSPEYVISGVVIYLSYLLLFIHFFYEVYIVRRNTKKTISADESASLRKTGTNSDHVTSREQNVTSRQQIPEKMKLRKRNTGALDGTRS